MNEPISDRQLLLDLRREFEEFRAETRADIDKISDDMNHMARYSIGLNEKGQKLSDYVFGYVKRIYNDIDILYDMVAPLEQKFFPEVNKARGKFNRISDKLAMEKEEERLQQLKDSFENKKDDDPPENSGDDQPRS
jgi:hypothetical protein